MAFAQLSSTDTGSKNQSFLSYESKPPYTHRSAVEEWAPHAKQTNYTKNGGIPQLY